MTRKLLIPAVLVALFAVACAAPPPPPVAYGAGQGFVPVVVDTLDDVGQGASVAVSADGVPYVSYFGFTGVVAEGQIAIPRPIGSAFLPGVLLASVSKDGIFTRGAVQQTKPDVPPSGILTPFRPQTVTALDLTAANANGSSVAVAADGTVHVAWTAGRFVYEAKVVSGADAAVSKVYDAGTAVSQAGPLGRPAIALDASGTPWIAFGVNDASGSREVVATPGASGWDVQDVAAVERCNGCAQPLPSGVAFVGGSALVVFGDPAKGSVEYAVPGAEVLPGLTASDATGATGATGPTGATGATGAGGTPVPSPSPVPAWIIGTVEAKASGAGLSLAATPNGAVASYYTGAGAVHVATFDGTSWSTAEVVKVTDATATDGLAAPSTGVAAAADGTTWVAWQGQGVAVASGKDGSFTTQTVAGTTRGAGPAIAVGADGSVFLSWYDTEHQDLMLAVQGGLAGTLWLANPSPAPTMSLAPTADTSCGTDKKVALSVVAKGMAFDLKCLVAPAGSPFTISFDNQDAGVLHNVAIYTDSSAATNLFRGEIVTGPVKTDYKVDALKAGTYFFRCDVHATTMFGTLVVVDGAK